MTAFKAGLIQTNVSNEMAENVAFVREQAKRARDAGADFVMTPENTGLIGANRTETLAEGADGRRARDARGLPRLCARDRGVVPARLDPCPRAGRGADPQPLLPDRSRRRHRRELRQDPHVRRRSWRGGESYRESSTFKPGERSVLAETPWGVLGMTICYDLRFPYLYRDLAHAGATMLSIPSSFTVPTGKAHWHTLMRARAIETGCYVFAPAQVGTHKGSGRKTYGHSIAVAPWGEVIWPMPAARTAGFVIADVDLAKVDEARKMVPSLQHDRKYAPPALAKPRRQGGGVAA